MLSESPVEWWGGGEHNPFLNHRGSELYMTIHDLHMGKV